MIKLIQSDKFQNRTFFLFAILFSGLAIIGGIQSYSPVPHWDMWNGYLGFFTSISNGDLTAWWDQHNEHRIFLSRILFWIDLTVFRGQGWFLIFSNYILLFISCFIFLKIWRRIEVLNQRRWFGYFLICWLVWWLQETNLVWGFQSQFILAQLLPLLSFYLLYCASIIGPKHSGAFYCSTATAILAVGSMANGILTLPLMVIFATLVKMRPDRIFFLLFLTVSSLYIYFVDYEAPHGHGALYTALLNNPLGLAHYIAVYIGGPFSFGSQSVGLWTSTIAGSLLFLSCTYISMRLVFSTQKDTLQLMLLFYILYVGGTAFGTGSGRVIFGIEQALSSRYMTPSLMAWAAFFLLLYRRFEISKLINHNRLWKWLLTLLIFMLPQQAVAIKSRELKIHERFLAALALELGVFDQNQIRYVFPDATWALEIVKTPIQQNWSVFGTYPLIDLRETLGQSPEQEMVGWRDCQGSITNIDHIDDEVDFQRVGGTISWNSDIASNDLLTFINSDNQITGYGLTGINQRNPDFNGEETYSFVNFTGYLSSRNAIEELYVYHQVTDCKIRLSLGSISVPTPISQISGR